ncbi:MAG: Translation initiation factor IF-3 [Chlamydiia bacterium]|nr:Translation initiation factor IF-3 [Chlamydiia bacterium]
MRINKQIRATKVRVINSQGEQVGVISVEEALNLASDEGLDLVEIAPQASPPVCKIIDYGKFRYQQTKKDKENKKAQHQAKLKEVKMKPNIDEHDFQVKLKRARDFILKGDKVKVTCVFRGREIMHSEIGRNVMKRFCEGLEDIANVESHAKLLGRSLSLVLAPLGKKKQQEKISAKNENA